MDDPAQDRPEDTAACPPPVLLGIASPVHTGTTPAEPATPARQLGEWMNRTGTSAEQVAADSGLPVDTIRRVANGTLPVDVTIATALHRGTDIDAGLWIALQAYDARPAPCRTRSLNPVASEDRPER